MKIIKKLDGFPSNFVFFYIEVAARRGLIFIFEGNPGCGNHEKVAGNK